MIRSLASRLLGSRRAGCPILPPVQELVPAQVPAPSEPVAPSFPADPYVAQQHLLQGLGISDPVIFDIGAHKGTAALAYRALLPGARIFCFEPFPDTVEALRQNLANDPAATVVPKAVSDRSGRRTFFVNGFDATNSLLPRPTTARRYYPRHASPKTTTEVETITLDEFVSSGAAPDPTVLKFDIQGGERMALKGAAALLRRGTVQMIYSEVLFVHLYEGCPLFHDISADLAGAGYHLFDIYNLHRAENGQLRYGDAIFVNENVRMNCINRGPEEP